MHESGALQGEVGINDRLWCGNPETSSECCNIEIRYTIGDSKSEHSPKVEWPLAEESSGCDTCLYMRLRLTAGLLRDQVDHNDDIVSTVSNKLQLKQTSACRPSFELSFSAQRRALFKCHPHWPNSRIWIDPDTKGIVGSESMRYDNSYKTFVLAYAKQHPLLVATIPDCSISHINPNPTIVSSNGRITPSQNV